MKILARPIYLILAISMLTLTTGNYPAEAQTTSGIDWTSICNTVSAALLQHCETYVNQDGTFTPEGERAFGCIRNGVLMAGGAMALGGPTPIIIAGLRTLADQTGCGNIVNWNLVSLSDLEITTEPTSTLKNGVKCLMSPNKIDWQVKPCSVGI